MKLKYAWVALIALAFVGCTDNTGSLGLGMFPEGDLTIKGNLKTFDVTTQSELSGRTFAKTSYGYVGKFTDPYFGYYEAGFLNQLHCTNNFQFPAIYDKEKDPTGVMVKDEIYQAELILSYATYFGDSLTPCRMSVYELDKPIDKNAALYTDIDPTDYYNPKDSKSLIGRKAYSAVDLSLSDSLRASQDFYPYVRITLSKEVGTRIYKAARAAGDKGLNNETFQEIFKGIYVKSDFGDGTVLYIDQIQMNIAFETYEKDETDNTKVLKKKYEKDENGVLKDSTKYEYVTFVATKEIIQANKFKNDQELIKKRKNEKEWTYLKTPAGIYTQATLPLKQIESELAKDTINAVQLTFTNYNQTNDYNKYKFSIGAPTYVLLVREKDKEAFFEENKVNDGVTSFLSQHNAIAVNQYVFSNLTKLVSTCLDEKRTTMKKEGLTEEQYVQKYPLWDKVALIPVLVNKDESNNILSVQNDLRPGYAKLKGGLLGSEENKAENKLKLEVLYTSFGGNK